jgi:ABC-type nitrate/sulfonate/bicarbonate transport system substrate-binding protein
MRMAFMKRILLMVVVLAALAVVFGCAPSTSKMDSVTVAIAPFESVGLVFVAQDQNMFEKNGVRVTYRKYDTGVGAMEGVLKGEADIAVGTTEYPLAGKAFAGEPVSAIACIDRPDFTYLVGRKDRGINKPSDLRGKRIGTVAGSIAQFYLGRFLELNNLASDDITLVDLRTPKEWRAAIASGNVDAVVLAQPEAGLVEGQLGDNATFFSVQGGQPSFALAVSKKEWIDRNPDSVRKFLAALADAEQFVESSPAETRAIIQKRLGLDSDYMDRVETQNTFALTLDQSLIIAMEDEARWMIKNRITPKTEVPNFTDNIYTDGLEQVKPDAVNIIR